MPRATSPVFAVSATSVLPPSFPLFLPTSQHLSTRQIFPCVKRKSAFTLFEQHFGNEEKWRSVILCFKGRVLKWCTNKLSFRRCKLSSWNYIFKIQSTICWKILTTQLLTKVVIVLSRIKDPICLKKSYFVKVTANIKLVINVTRWTLIKSMRSPVTKSVTLSAECFKKLILIEGTGGLGGAEMKTTRILNPRRDASQKAGPADLQVLESYL